MPVHVRCPPLQLALPAHPSLTCVPVEPILSMEHRMRVRNPRERHREERAEHRPHQQSPTIAAWCPSSAAPRSPVLRTCSSTRCSGIAAGRALPQPAVIGLAVTGASQPGQVRWRRFERTFAIIQLCLPPSHKLESAGARVRCGGVVPAEENAGVLAPILRNDQARHMALSPVKDRDGTRRLPGHPLTRLWGPRMRLTPHPLHNLHHQRGAG